jgi:PIN domain nuclease of toxin-antitoxin system
MRDPNRLSSVASGAIASPQNQIFVSVASLWEIAIKAGLGKLNFPPDTLEERLRLSGFDVLTIRPAHAIAAGGLPRHHGDPFDRMLVVQARLEQLVLVAADAAFANYDVALLW